MTLWKSDLNLHWTTLWTALLSRRGARKYASALVAFGFRMAL